MTLVTANQRCHLAIDSVTRAAVGVRTFDAFKAWTRGSIRTALPHGALICGHGHMHAAGIGLDYPVNVDCPPSYLLAMRNRAGGWESPILRRWLATRRPLLFEADQPWDGLPVAWLDQFRKHGLRNLIAHAILDSERCTATYHCFYRLTGGLDGGLVDAVERLVPVMHEVLCSVVSHLQNDDRFAALLASLSPREADIARFVRLGKTNGEIACIFSLSENTVKHHLTRILRKLEVDNRMELLSRMVEHEGRIGLVAGPRIF